MCRASTPSPPATGSRRRRYRVSGREGQKGTVAYPHSVFEDLNDAFDEIYPCANKVVACRDTLREVQRGVFLGLVPTAQRVEFMTMECHHFENERIATSWHIEDFHSVYQRPICAGAQAAP